MRSIGLSKQALRHALQQWLDLSVVNHVPISLLIMSRTFFLKEEGDASHGDQKDKEGVETICGIADAISGMEKEVVNEVLLEVATPEETKNNPEVLKTKLEVLQAENEKIDEEFKARKKLEKKEKEAKAKKKEEEEVRAKKKEEEEEEVRAKKKEEGEAAVAKNIDVLQDFAIPSGNKGSGPLYYEETSSDQQGKEKDEMELDIRQEEDEEVNLVQQLIDMFNDMQKSSSGADRDITVDDMATLWGEASKRGGVADLVTMKYIYECGRLTEEAKAYHEAMVLQLTEEGGVEEAPSLLTDAEESQLADHAFDDIEEEEDDQDLSAEEIEAIAELVSPDPVKKEKEELERMKAELQTVEVEEPKEDVLEIASGDAVVEDEIADAKSSAEAKREAQLDLVIDDTGASLPSSKAVPKVEDEMPSETATAAPDEEELHIVDPEVSSSSSSSASASASASATASATSATAAPSDSAASPPPAAAATDAMSPATASSSIPEEPAGTPAEEVKPEPDGKSQDEKKLDDSVKKLKEKVATMLEGLESQIEDIEEAVGDKMHILDKDGDGVMTVEEVVKALQTTFKRELSEKEALEIVKEIDSDSDGNFTVEELKEWVEINKLAKEVEEDRYEDLPNFESSEEESFEVGSEGEAEALDVNHGAHRGDGQQGKKKTKPKKKKAAKKQQ